MFIDEIHLVFSAGKGGDGIVSWRREKYLPKGGPFGGDGGDGGDIILRSTPHENTLSRFRHRKKIKAKNGERGGTQEMRGANAENLVVEVPVGTIVSDKKTGEIIIDFTQINQEYLLCKGGRGGFGNAHFTSSTRQAPNFAELGDVGEEREIKMELKLVADIGLVGLPNAGKSTLIQALTNVRPKIADYAFTTLVPNLGVLEWKDRSIVIEDVPGLIAGANIGKGLGIKFLKHIDRCHMIIHLIDASQGEKAMIENYNIIRNELESWSDMMKQKKEIIIFTKSDIVDDEHMEEIISFFEKETNKTVALSISAGTLKNINMLKDILIKLVPKQIQNTIPKNNDSATKIYDLKRQYNPRHYAISRLANGDFHVTGDRIEEIVRMTDVRYTDSINRVYDVLEKLGILQKIQSSLSKEIKDSAGKGFFEGEDDYSVPNIVIADKSFSLEGLLFSKK